MLAFQVQNPSKEDQCALIQCLRAEGCQPAKIHWKCVLCMEMLACHEEKVYQHAQKGCYCVEWQCQIPCCVHCPEHAAQLALESVGTIVHTAWTCHYVTSMYSASQRKHQKAMDSGQMMLRSRWCSGSSSNLESSLGIWIDQLLLQWDHF
jgi:hypothetical protein